MAKFILATLIFSYILIGFFKLIKGQDECPGYFRTICNFTTKGNDQHFRDCNKDIFMSLCAITNGQYNKVQMDFMCWNLNYCLGCRDCYTLCCDEAAMCSTDINVLSYFLGWYDAFTMGGKFVMCDYSFDFLNESIYSNNCFQKNEVQTDLTNCINDLTRTVHYAYKEDANCSTMNDKIECFLTALDQCPTKDPQNVMLQYFRGVVSLSPCVGLIPVVGGKASIMATSLTTILTMVFVTVIVTYMPFY